MYLQPWEDLARQQAAVLEGTTAASLVDLSQAMDPLDRHFGRYATRGLSEEHIRGLEFTAVGAALATVLMDYPLGIQEVDRQGIGDMDTDQIRAAMDDGQRWKLICSVWRESDRVLGRVRPERVGPEDPLYHVRGTSSQITFTSDVLGDLTIMGTDPGPDTTAYGMFADLLNAVRMV